VSDQPKLAGRLDLASSEAFRGRELACTIVNTGPERFVCGLGYRLERETDGGWVLANPGEAFAAVGFPVEPGHEHGLTVRIPVNALPGHYRVLTSVGRSRGILLTLAAQFEVR
jgi:hypothetical protein